MAVRNIGKKINNKSKKKKKQKYVPLEGSHLLYFIVQLLFEGKRVGKFQMFVNKYCPIYSSPQI